MREVESLIKKLGAESNLVSPKPENDGQCAVRRQFAGSSSAEQVTASVGAHMYH